MIKVLILDDEINCNDTLELMIEKKFSDKLAVIATCTSVQAALEQMEISHPDVVFLDIEMPIGSGFDFLQNVKNHDFQVVFVTAHESYALRAIKFNAIDFLLKPINPVELELTVNKIIYKIEQEQISGMPEIKNLIENLKTLQSDSKKIALIGVKQTIFVEIKEIIRCEYKDPNSIVHLTNDRIHYSTRPLKEFEELLLDYNFVRVNPSSIINITHVKAYINGNGGFAIMSDGEKIEISRRKKGEFISKTTKM